VNFQGKYYQANDCEIRPRGPRPEGPPLLVGSFGPRMLRLTAQYADMWNTAYLSQPETLDKPLQELHAACEAVQRDPATLGVTALVALNYPDLAEPPEFENGVLSGSNESIAQAMQAYEQSGVDHLIFHLVPYTPLAVRRLAAALKIYHS
jgi:alkanesulfonate monooxygenase SsuD/methylene tetrahydromethanopterin reductase-like flavin-dependent oxidoreductase (luciferase family)